MQPPLAQDGGLTGISHGEELFGILTVSLSADALWGCQLQAQRDVAVRFYSAVTALPDGGSIGDVLITGSVGGFPSRPCFAHKGVFDGDQRPSGGDRESPPDSKTRDRGGEHHVETNRERAALRRRAIVSVEASSPAMEVVTSPIACGSRL